MNEVRHGSYQDQGTTFPIKMEKEEIQALFDTGALKSVMSEEHYLKMKLPPLSRHRIITAVGAGGMDLGALGTVKAKFKLGKHWFEQEFLVCRHLRRPVILGVDFNRNNCIGIEWTEDGRRRMTYKKDILAECDDPAMGIPIRAAGHIRVPPKHVMVVNARVNSPMEGMYYTHSNDYLEQDHPTAYLPQVALRHSEEIKGKVVPLPILNLDNNDYLDIEPNTVLAFAQPAQPAQDIDVIDVASVQDLLDDIKPAKDIQCRNWIPKRVTQEEAVIAEIAKVRERIPHAPEDSAFICSPADIDQHRKVLLQDAKIQRETRARFQDICTRYPEVFSKSNTDIGRTKLLEMDILTGNSPPICQKPYTLPLKHYDWVKQEIETLEKAGVIEHSISPWASPIVVVPKKAGPDEPPRRRLCVDFRKLNQLQPETKRVDINQRPETKKTPLTLHPLPKIDDIFARLNGAKIFSTLDLRSGYYHISLTPDAREKTAFVTPFGKYEFLSVPFGLSQAPAYFQLLISMVLEGLDFAIGYLDDIIIFSKTEEEHLKHVETIFERLKSAGLKLKLSKCEFFKKHIHYLGHLISDEGIQPLPEKLEAVRQMPPPVSAKEVKQFLGLVGYYRKFVPRFADISRPLTQLTCANKEFLWDVRCQTAFEYLKESLCKAPILVFPDPNLPYTLFTDASKYAWAGVLTQQHEMKVKDKLVPTDLPVAFVSGLFRGSQLNWAALTKEAFAIYMSVKKLDFYLNGADILLRSDHLPLKRFLEKNTLNAKVNNWAVELESYNIKFSHIAGVKNRLADALSRLIEMDPESKLEPEPPGYEFGYSLFDTLEPARTTDFRTIPAQTRPALPAAHIEVYDIQDLYTPRDCLLPTAQLAQVDPILSFVDSVDPATNTDSGPKICKGEQGREGLETIPAQLAHRIHMVPVEREKVKNLDTFFVQDPSLASPLEEVRVEVPQEMKDLRKLQEQDLKCSHLISQIRKSEQKGETFAGVVDYKLKDGILYRKVKLGREKFDAIVIPKSMKEAVLVVSHDHSGHNGSTRTYMAVRRIYYWKGMKKDIANHVKRCKKCQEHNVVPTRYARNTHFRVPTAPMQFISMDLIGEFYPPSSSGNKYALTVIDMFTGFTWCIPIKNKTHDAVIDAYVKHVWTEFGGSARIISDNGSEFKNQFFEVVAKKLNVKHRLFSPPYRPQSNGRIEGFHRFLKACIGKHIAAGREWDKVTHLATSAYNFYPNEHSKESAFFLMFGRDPMCPLTTFLEDKTRYMGNEENLLDLQTMQNCYEAVATQIEKARKQHGPKITLPFIRKLKVGDSVLVRDHTSKSFEAKYKPDYRVIGFKGQNTVVLKDSEGSISEQHLSNVKFVEPVDRVIAQIPTQNTAGRQAKFRLSKDNIPDLKWELAEETNTNFHAKQPYVVDDPAKPRTRRNREILQVQLNCVEEGDEASLLTEELPSPIRKLRKYSGCAICAIHDNDYTKGSRKAQRKLRLRGM